MWIVRDILEHARDNETDPKSPYYNTWIFHVRWCTVSGEPAGTSWENPLCPESSLSELSKYHVYCDEHNLKGKASAARRGAAAAVSKK